MADWYQKYCAWTERAWRCCDRCRSVVRMHRVGEKIIVRSRSCAAARAAGGLDRFFLMHAGEFRSRTDAGGLAPAQSREIRVSERPRFADRHDARGCRNPARIIGCTEVAVIARLAWSLASPMRSDRVYTRRPLALPALSRHEISVSEFVKRRLARSGIGSVCSVAPKHPTVRIYSRATRPTARTTGRTTTISSTTAPANCPAPAAACAPRR